MVDLYIVGLGVANVDHVTREAESAIRQSREVLYLDTGVATQRFLEQRCARVTSLYEESYREEDLRLNAYRHMAARVIDAALDHAPVTLAIHGHPVVAVYAPFLILDMAELLGLTVRILPGISAMDCVFAELKIDPCVHGLQMYEATDLLLRGRPLQADVPALIWQIGNLETRLHTSRVSKPERFDRFVNYLLRFYPVGHNVVAIYVAPHPLMPSTIRQFPLGKLREHAEHLHAGFTLYIPAVAERAIEDIDLLRKIDSPEHLRDITR